MGKISVLPKIDPYNLCKITKKKIKKGLDGMSRRRYNETNEND